MPVDPVDLFKGMMSGMYVVTDDEKAPFAKNWCGPEKFEKFKKTLIATFRGDFRTVKVYCKAAPARFYDIEAFPTPAGAEESDEGFVLSTGTIDPELVAQVADAISNGTMSVRQ